MAISRAGLSLGFDRTMQGLAVTHQLVLIGCASRNLRDSPVGIAAQSCHIHLEKEIAERGIRRRTRELKAQRVHQRAVVSGG